jgi:hypothetical protein
VEHPARAPCEIIDQVKPDLDSWLERPLITVRHRRSAKCDPAVLWDAARSVRLADTRALGRLVRVRIPGTPAGMTFDQLLRSQPFTVLQEGDGQLLSGLVGRIWTLRRDYPVLAEPDEFHHWKARGTVRVLFGVWVERLDAHTSLLISETRVDAVDLPARLGLAALRPLISTSNSLVGSEALALAVRRAQSSTEVRS